jgi:protein SCO1/2
VAAHAATDGFEAFTLESARRLHALRSPVPVPDLALELADGGRMRLSEASSRVILIDFVYTSCPTRCAGLGSSYGRLQARLAREIAAGDVRLLSISFDPQRDGPAELREYRARYSRQAAGWDLARPTAADDLVRWLAAFGVVVIPDELGGYAHNAAVHVVGPQRRLVAIFELDDLDGIVRAAREVAGGSVNGAATR